MHYPYLIKISKKRIKFNQKIQYKHIQTHKHQTNVRPIGTLWYHQLQCIAPKRIQYMYESYHDKCIIERRVSLARVFLLIYFFLFHFVGYKSRHFDFIFLIFFVRKRIQYMYESYHADLISLFMFLRRQMPKLNLMCCHLKYCIYILIFSLVFFIYYFFFSSILLPNENSQNTMGPFILILVLLVFVVVAPKKDD